jgi:hypothetical protein
LDNVIVTITGTCTPSKEAYTYHTRKRAMLNLLRQVFGLGSEKLGKWVLQTEQKMRADWV